MIDIFEYLDYRQFLRELYAEKKKLNRHFSYRYLAQKTGLKSPGFFTWVLQGKRNLSPHLVLKFALAFKLTRPQTAYLELLVSYNQAKSHEEKKHHFDKMLRHRHTKSIVVRPDQYAFYEQWYHTVIRELLAIHPFRGDYSALAKSIIPAISPLEAKKSIDLLEKLNLIQKDEDSAFRPTENTLTTGDKWRAFAVRQFQHQTMDLAKRALDQIPKERRDVSTITVSCSLNTYAAIREKVQIMRQEIASIVANDENPEGVFQFNFQIFPFAWPATPSIKGLPDGPKQ